MATSKRTQDLTSKTNLSATDQIAFIRQSGGIWTDFRGTLADIAKAFSDSDTAANITTAKSNGTLIANSWYFISDRDKFVFAISSTQFTTESFLNAFNADYQAAGSYAGVTIANGFTVNATGTQLKGWHTGLAPVAGDCVIYNDTHYLNLVGAVGTAPSGDAVNWEIIADTTTPTTRGYINEIDYIGYDYDKDLIILRKDALGNEVYGSTNQALFPWGNDGIVTCRIRGTVTLSGFYNHRGEAKRNQWFDGTITSDETAKSYIYESWLEADMAWDFSGSSSEYNWLGKIQTFSTKIVTAAVLTLNATPVVLVSKVTAGAICLLSAEMWLDYNSATYAANTNLVIYTNTIAEDQATGTSYIASASDSYRKFTLSNTDDNLIASSTLKVAVASGDPTTGDSPVYITGTFKIVAPELTA